MKRISTVAIIVLLSGISGLSKTRAQTQDPILAIRQQYASINRNVAKYRKVKKELLGFSAEGGELVAYLKGPSIMKISATFYGEMGRSVEELYYWNDRLIFVFRKQLNYSAPLSGKVTSTRENRYYFKDDKLIRWIGEDGGLVAANAPEFGQSEQRLLESSKELIDGARSKNPTIEAVP